MGAYDLLYDFALRLALRLRYDLLYDTCLAREKISHTAKELYYDIVPAEGKKGLGRRGSQTKLYFQSP